MHQFNRLGLPIFAVVIVIVVIVLPTIRLRRRTGLWPISRARLAEPLQIYVGACLALSIIGYGAWMLCYGLTSPQRLCVWNFPTVMNWCGWIAAVVGLAIIAIAQAHMGISWRIGVENAVTPLVSRGLFGLVRNPIYTGWAIILLGVFFITPSPWTAMGWLVVATLLGMQARLEERHLMAMHSEAYREYASRVGRFLPGVGRLKNPPG